jgi:CheY-like chemotaxis protein
MTIESICFWLKLLKNHSYLYYNRARDGNDAVENTYGQPDAILMDVQMPNKTVIRLEEIRKIKGSKNIPIIAVTAGILLGEKENALNQEWMIICQSQLSFLTKENSARSRK